MAVFTQISDEEFSSILTQYDIGRFVTAEGISEGVENTNYRIFTDKDKFIFTVYEDRVDISDLPFFIQLQKKLFDSGFRCPNPIANSNGDIINSYKEKYFTIVSHIKGKWERSLSNNVVLKAGEALADMHVKTSSFKGLSRENSMGRDFWFETYDKVKEKSEDAFPELVQIVEKTRKILMDKWPKGLETGIIHADYFPDNVMFYDKEVSGVIDFYMSCNDVFIYDLAIALNAWCFEKDCSFNITKAKIFLSSYNKKRQLSNDELNNLPIICLGASMRFLSTRLYDYFKESDGLVSKKDPKEYIEKLKFHLQVDSFSEYGI